MEQISYRQLKPLCSKHLGRMALKSLVLLKQNIRTLLQARGLDQKDLAIWCGKTESWISQILNPRFPNRGFEMQYLDKMADFFGLTAHELFQPGLSHLTERRSGKDRRSGVDRRVNRAGEILEPAPDIQALLQQSRYLTVDQQRAFARRANAALVDLAAQSPSGRGQHDQEDRVAPPRQPARRSRATRKTVGGDDAA